MINTIDKLYSIFIQEKKVSCSDDTVSYYSFNLEKFIKFLCVTWNCESSDIDIQQIDRMVINDFILNLRSVNKYAGHPFIYSASHIKNTSINTYVRALKVFFQWCYDEGFVDKNCCDKIKLPRQDQDVIVPLYQAEVDLIDSKYNSKTETGLRNLCIIHLMLDAGCRRSEVVNLKIKDICFDNNYLYIYGKGSKYRIVPLAPGLSNILYKYCVLYRRFLSPDNVMDQNVFVKVNAPEFINKTTINQLFRRLKKSTGIERLHPHLLRHTFATSFIMGGGNLEFLRMIMGHSDYNITRRYLHLANQNVMLGTNIYKLDPIFFRSMY